MAQHDQTWFSFASTEVVGFFWLQILESCRSFLLFLFFELNPFTYEHVVSVIIIKNDIWSLAIFDILISCH